VGLIAVGMVVLAGSGLVPILHASLVAAMLLVAFRVLTPGEARAAVNLDVIIVIAAAFALGGAMESSGLADVVAHGLASAFSRFGPLGVLFGILVTTIVVLEMITNNAAAVLMFPIAMAAAAEVGAEPRLFALALAITASASFLTPIGYQTNTMVYGMGGYRFGDFARLGLPLTLLVLGSIMLVARFLY
jgi:di/tricarboxylate transporter